MSEHYSISAHIQRASMGKGWGSGWYNVRATYYGEGKSQKQLGHPTQSIASELRTLAVTFKWMPVDVISQLAQEIEREFYRRAYQRGGLHISKSMTTTPSEDSEECAD